MVLHLSDASWPLSVLKISVVPWQLSLDGQVRKFPSAHFLLHASPQRPYYQHCFIPTISKIAPYEHKNRNKVMHGVSPSPTRATLS